MWQLSFSNIARQNRLVYSVPPSQKHNTVTAIVSFMILMLKCTLHPNCLRRAASGGPSKQRFWIINRDAFYNILIEKGQHGWGLSVK
jgi:hypothetical protein